MKRRNATEGVAWRCSGRLVWGEDLGKFAWDVIGTKHKSIVLDLRQVAAVDATGLGILVGLYRWSRVMAVQMKLIPNRRLHELLKITGLDKIFNVVGVKTYGFDYQCFPSTHINHLSKEKLENLRSCCARYPQRGGS